MRATEPVLEILFLHWTDSFAGSNAQPVRGGLALIVSGMALAREEEGGLTDELENGAAFAAFLIPAMASISHECPPTIVAVSCSSSESSAAWNHGASQNRLEGA